MRVISTRRIIVAAIVLITSLFMFSAGYFQEEGDVYIFPVIVASVMLLFSSFSMIRETFQLCLEDFQEFPFKRQIPVISILILGVALVETLGMFSTTFAMLLMVSYWYSAIEIPKQRLIRSLLFSAGFTLAMYLLFSVMLNVQLPRGLIF